MGTLVKTLEGPKKESLLHLVVCVRTVTVCVNLDGHAQKRAHSNHLATPE